MKSKVQVEPRKMIKRGKHGHTGSIDSTKHSASIFDEFKELKTDRPIQKSSDLPESDHNVPQEAINEYEEFLAHKDSTERLERIIQEVRTIDERAHHDTKNLLNEHLDREYERNAILRELKFERFKQAKKDKQNAKQMQALWKLMQEKDKIQKYQHQLKLIKQGKSFKESSSDKRSSLNKSMKQTNKEKIHKALSPYGAYCNSIKSKKLRRLSKTNSAMSSPRSSSISITPFEENKAAASSSAMTTPRKGEKHRYESNNYSDQSVPSKRSFARSKGKFSYKHKVQKTSGARSSGKSSSFICTEGNSQPLLLLKTPVKHGISKNPYTKDERGSRAD